MLLFQKRAKNWSIHKNNMIFKAKLDHVKEVVTLVKPHTIQEMHFTLKWDNKISMTVKYCFEDKNIKCS